MCNAATNTNLICDSPRRWAEHDAQGIYLCLVCDDCREAKLSRYRPEILTGYSQADVDEPIDSEDDRMWFGRPRPW